jgi:GT2 family glycosyltransferase
MITPLISFLCSSIRIHNWERIYTNLSEENNIPFEIVFIGPHSPEGIYKLPDNCKFIQTSVKPSQCIEIAARNAMGEYLIIMQDDIILDKHFLNKVGKWMSKLNMKDTLIGFRYNYVRDSTYGNKYSTYNIIPDDDSLQFFGVFTAGVNPMFKKEIWHKLGGIDRRFDYTWCDIDMIFRFYEYGFHPFLTPDCIMVEVRLHKKSLFYSSVKQAGELMNSMWLKNNVFSRNRLLSVESFSDKDILLKNQ